MEVSLLTIISLSQEIQEPSAPISPALQADMIYNHQSFFQITVFLLFAFFQFNIEASPFSTAQNSQNDPSANKTTTNINPMIYVATTTSPWLLCLDQVDILECYYEHATNCGNDSEVKSGSQSCIEYCGCVNGDIALRFARNTSVRNPPIHLARDPLSRAASDVDQLMASTEKQYEGIVAHSTIDQQLTHYAATVHNEYTTSISTSEVNCRTDEMLALYDDTSSALPQSTLYDGYPNLDTYTRLGMEIHKPLLEASLGSTMIPVNQEHVAADGTLHRPPTSLDIEPAHITGFDFVEPTDDEISKILGFPLHKARDGSPQPGRSHEEDTMETASSGSDSEG
ncbi:hypothetical protein VPNG_08719 [Cytospora leucostoma]|uniref:Uncharacterized protein n=1 Tax=Cytospora leucostoma TaxID=1230097 RepID=A0A423W2I6_9PEZI|nr:hypothetical protein VPNG_08719 [Cytospora leucostoma]